MVHTLDFYYHDFMEYHLDTDAGHDDITDQVHTYCDETAAHMAHNECISIINEMFDDPLNAIQEYINEYGDIPIYDNNVNRTYGTLCFLAMHRYILDQLGNDEPDIINHIEPVVFNDDERSVATTEEDNNSSDEDSDEDD
jgi:hypothetical protein